MNLHSRESLWVRSLGQGRHPRPSKGLAALAWLADVVIDASLNGSGWAQQESGPVSDQASAKIRDLFERGGVDHDREPHNGLTGSASNMVPAHKQDV
jgi:hypothetical protein